MTWLAATARRSGTSLIAGYRYTNLFFVIMALAALLSRCAHYDFVYPHDDAFITYRYAWNLAHGNGLVFNVGERVWGFTLPLFTILIAAGSALGFDPTTAGVILSSLSAALLSLLLFEITALFQHPLLALLVSVYFFGWNVWHAGLGLESSLLVALQCAFLLLMACERPKSACFAAALSCLARPDSILLVLPVILACRPTRSIKALLIFLVPGALWLIFALTYFGELIPNSFYAKEGLSSFRNFFLSTFLNYTNVLFPAGLNWLAEWRRFFPFSEAVWSGAGLVVFSALLCTDHRLRRYPYLLYAVTLYPWLLAASYSWIGSLTVHTWEVYSGCFFFRVGLILSLISLCERLAAAPGFSSLAARWSGWLLRAALVFGLLVGAAGNLEKALRSLETLKHQYWFGNRHAAYTGISRWINENLPEKASVGAHEVGTIGYYTRRQIIDLSGIVTKGYTRAERHKAQKLLARFKPDYFLAYGRQPLLHTTDSSVYRSVHFFPAAGFESFSLLQRETRTE